MVFQMFYLFPHLTALENAGCSVLPMRACKRKKKRKTGESPVSEKLTAERAHFQLPPEAFRYGQRVAIARALAVKPKMMLFGRANLALDPELRHEVLGKSCGDLAEEAAHDHGHLSPRNRLCRKCRPTADFHDSRIAEDGSPQALTSKTAKPTFTGIFTASSSWRYRPFPPCAVRHHGIVPSSLPCAIYKYQVFQFSLEVRAVTLFILLSTGRACPCVAIPGVTTGTSTSQQAPEPSPEQKRPMRPRRRTGERGSMQRITSATRECSQPRRRPSQRQRLRRLRPKMRKRYWRTSPPLPVSTAMLSLPVSSSPPQYRCAAMPFNRQTFNFNALTYLLFLGRRGIWFYSDTAFAPCRYIGKMGLGHAKKNRERSNWLQLPAAIVGAFIIDLLLPALTLFIGGQMLSDNFHAGS